MSVMVWGCKSTSSVGDLVKSDGIMNAEKYHQMFMYHTTQSGKVLIGSGFTLQHDNNFKHTANACKAYLNRTNTVKHTSRGFYSPEPAMWGHHDREQKGANIQRTVLHVLRETWRTDPEHFLRQCSGSCNEKKGLYFHL